MTTLDREYEDVVRRALVAAAESIEPAGDGLQRIRHRLSTPRSLGSVTASVTEWLRLSGIRFSVRLEPATETGRAALGQMRHMFTGPGQPSGPFLTRGRPSADRPGRRGRARRGSALGPAAAWLRPVLAVSAVVVIVVAAMLALDRSHPTLITPTNSVSAHDADAAGPASGTAEVVSVQPWAPLGTIPTAAPTAENSQPYSGGTMMLLPTVARSVKASPSPSQLVSTATPTTPAATATPTDTTQATPTPTLTPTPTTTPVVTPTPSAPGGGSSGSAGTATQAG